MVSTSPIISYFVTGGTLKEGAPSYVSRQVDEKLFHALQAGQFCFVLDSRQVGKSSLMVSTGSAAL